MILQFDFSTTQDELNTDFVWETLSPTGESYGYTFGDVAALNADTDQIESKDIIGTRKVIFHGTAATAEAKADQRNAQQVYPPIPTP